MRRIEGLGVTAKVLENLVNDRRRLDAGIDAQPAAALPAGLDVDGDDKGGDGHPAAHLDRCSGDLAVALRVMEVADREPATVDVTRRSPTTSSATAFVATASIDSSPTDKLVKKPDVMWGASLLRCPGVRRSWPRADPVLTIAPSVRLDDGPSTERQTPIGVIGAEMAARRISVVLAAIRDQFSNQGPDTPARTGTVCRWFSSVPPGKWRRRDGTVSAGTGVEIPYKTLATNTQA